jgi:hypothetical protein
MSIVIKTSGKTKEYFLNQVGNVCCGSGANGSGLYLSDGKVIDGNGVDVTDKLDLILTESIVPGDMIIEFEE